MPPRSKPGELPKPVVQKDAVGAMPLNALTASSLHQGVTQSLIGLRDSEQSQSLKTNTCLSLSDGKKKLSLALSGRFFNGYSDALYRGQLPEVLFLAPSAELLPECLQNIVDYIERLATLGFFIPKKMVSHRDAVSELLPCIVLIGNGLLFSRFMTGLTQAFKYLLHEHPSLTEAVRLKILGRFVRAFPASAAQEIPNTATQQHPLSHKLPLVQFPQHFRMAGGDIQTQTVIQSVLGRQGILMSVENHSANPVERLELQNAFWRFSQVILPALVDHNHLSAKEAKALSPKIEQGIQVIGLKRAALSEAENLQHWTQSQSSAKSPSKAKKAAVEKNTQASLPSENRLNWNDVAIVAGLTGYARALNLSEESQLFGQLAQQLIACCEPA